jgi:EAL domain-containing protein (putative c-di-GMP-specific phosphodiesterase class I)
MTVLASDDDDGVIELRTEQLASDLHGAVRRGEIVAWYQPQVRVDTRQVISAEALSRWMHPEFGIVPPGTFIPLAEELGLITEIGDHMIELGCRSAARWQNRAAPIEVAVNVSAIQLRNPAFAERLIQAMRSADLDPRLLTIEVTETSEIIDVSTVAERLDWLRSVGVTISVDDFGVGHSSVEQVLDLRATELKIDQSLVRDESNAARTLLAAVVTFARDKGLRVVAEGVETEAQFARVRDLHCHRAQGFLLGRPMPVTDFDVVLDAGTP